MTVHDPTTFDADADTIVRFLKRRGETDPHLQVQIEAAFWEAAAAKERANVEALTGMAESLRSQVEAAQAAAAEVSSDDATEEA